MKYTLLNWLKIGTCFWIYCMVVTCWRLNIECTLIVPPPFGPSYILEISNILREKFLYKLHDFLNLEFEIQWKINECGGLKRGGITRVHCTCIYICIQSSQ